MAGSGAEFFGKPATHTYLLPSALGSDNAAVAADHPVCLRSIQGYNNKAAKVFIKLYQNWAGAAPAATDTPVKSIAVPASAAFVFDFAAGFEFPKGCGVRITAGAALADNTALTAADVDSFNMDFS